MATQEDRSLSSGMSFPRWMKTKMNDKLDFEQSAFSPTELDDSFMFYYRNNARGNSGEQTNVLNSAITQHTPQNNDAPSSSSNSGNTKRDFSKHTLSCQKYLKESIDTTAAQKVAFPDSSAKTKSSGTDDGFKGEAAKCGTSVLRVAHQMVAGKVIRGFHIEPSPQVECNEMKKSATAISIDDPNPADRPPPGFNPSIRRGSRSLPASPLSTPTGSPKSARRVNKYFSGPFVDAEQQQGMGWMLSNLLASKRQVMSQSVGFIAEEEGEASGERRFASNASVDEGLADLTKKAQKFVASKPAELREMNFWSPTSM